MANFLLSFLFGQVIGSRQLRFASFDNSYILKYYQSLGAQTELLGFGSGPSGVQNAELPCNGINKFLVPKTRRMEGNCEFIAKIPKRKSIGWALYNSPNDSLKLVQYIINFHIPRTENNRIVFICTWTYDLSVILIW